MALQSNTQHCAAPSWIVENGKNGECCRCDGISHFSLSPDGDLFLSPPSLLTPTLCLIQYLEILEIPPKIFFKASNIQQPGPNYHKTSYFSFQMFFKEFDLNK